MLLCYIDYYLPLVMAGIKFAVCVRVTVCSARISSESGERIWLRFCTGTEVCLSQCISNFDGDRPMCPSMGAENVVIWGRQCFSLAVIISYSFARLQHMLEILCQSRTDQRVMVVTIRPSLYLLSSKRYTLRWSISVLTKNDLYRFLSRSSLLHAAFKLWF